MRRARSHRPKLPTALVAAAMALAPGCSRTPDPPALFQSLAPESTGITFVDRLPETPDFNILSYLYYYDGGGVAVGDINGDGLPDLYFTSNVGPNHLYLNKGNYHFEDITASAGVADPDGWKTGVTMADVNGDGRPDIYVSAVDYLGMHGHNVLYVNNGDGTFTDRTKEYGLDFAGYSTQALFFDYDGDGLLDMYLLNHSVHSERGPSSRPQRTPRHAKAGDRLYRNVGGRFVDVSERTGIYGGVEGYGLGVVASDLESTGCPDLYVANDFQENDFLYHNNCDGTFTESIGRATGHVSFSSMGVDAADFNDDGRPDLFVADMLPAREKILQTSATNESWDLFDLRVRVGYLPQYTRNTLQLNRGDGHFSEIGPLAGVEATDWSWAPLFADLDNDGREDLFLTTGIYHRPNDLDYVAYVGADSVQASLAKGITPANLAAALAHMPQVPSPNYAFRNNGDLTFTNMARAWGLAQPGFSNGAAYVDLNNSGALDLVVTHIDAPPSIYRNRARRLNGNSYLTVVLRGSGGNTAGIGAKVILRNGGRSQMLEQMPTRGFQSSVDPRLHFGLGRLKRVDSLVVIWPDRRYQVLTDVAVNRILTLRQQDAAGRYVYPHAAAAQRLFADESRRLGAGYTHRENVFRDYTREPLIPHLLSTEGPALAIGDVDGDGLDDIYVGGAKWQPGRLFLQQPDGTFQAREEPALAADSLAEDVDAAFFDADGDGTLDLYVVSGGNEFWGNADALRGRLYLNDGRGHFRRATGALPDFFVNGSCVVPGDFNGDGHPDLFVGGRVLPGQYGTAPRSYLLENDGRGHFVDVTAARAPGLAHVGMVTSAAWVDYDGDGRLDLVVAGEWMPVKVFHQEQGRLVDRTLEAGLAGTEGWWNTVTVADVNGDRRPDLVLGNLGLNSTLRASSREPARLYVGDFAHNGTQQPILTAYRDGESYPLAGRDELLRAIPPLRRRYPSYAAFAGQRMEDLFPASELRQAQVLEARVFASSIAINQGNGTFKLQSLPTEAQFAPVYAALAADFDGDGHTDLLLAGNLFGVAPVLGRYDASYGLLLRGTSVGRFQPVDVEESGLAIQGQVRHMALVRSVGGRPLVAVARNGESLQLLQPLRMAAATRPVAAASGPAPRRPAAARR